MPLKPKIAGDCHAAVPYEFPVVKSKTSQNFKNVLRALGELRCALAPEIDRCPPCDCPPCPPPEDIPEPDPIPFDGKPYENIYADTLNYIGNIGTVGTQADVVYRIFDPVTGEEVAQFLRDDGDGATWQTAQGTGAVWHRPTNTVWIAGETTTGVASLRVYDAAIMANQRDPDAAFVAQYDYAGYVFESAGDSQNAIEYCPQTGEIYVAFFVSGVSTFSVIDPSDGAIITDGKADVTPGWAFDTSSVFGFAWHPGVGKMIAFLLRDEFFTIDPVSYDTSQLSGNIGGLIDTGSGIHEAVYGGNGYMYIAPSKYSNVFRFANPDSLIPNNGSGGPACPTFKSGLAVDGSGGGSFVEAIPECKYVIISRGNDSLVFSDPDNQGIVEVVNADDANGVVATFRPNFNPARTAYCYSSQTLSVVPWWNQDTEWYVQFFRLTLGCAGGDVPGTDPPPVPSPGPEDPGDEDPDFEPEPGPPDQDPGAPPPGGGDEPAPPGTPDPPPPDGGSGACEHSGEGDTDGDGIIHVLNLKGQCTECPENGPIFRATSSHANVVCDQLPKPTISLVGLGCRYQNNNNETPYSGQVRVRLIVNLKSNMSSLLLKGPGCPSVPGGETSSLNGNIIGVYIMPVGEHPLTHPHKYGSANFGVGFTGGDGDLWETISGPINLFTYDNYGGGKPTCGGGTVPIGDFDGSVGYDIYARNIASTNSVSCGFGIVVSPWSVLKIRNLFYPPGWPDF